MAVILGKDHPPYQCRDSFSMEIQRRDAIFGTIVYEENGIKKYGGVLECLIKLDNHSLPVEFKVRIYSRRLIDFCNDLIELVEHRMHGLGACMFIMDLMNCNYTVAASSMILSDGLLMTTDGEDGEKIDDDKWGLNLVYLFACYDKNLLDGTTPPRQDPTSVNLGPTEGEFYTFARDLRSEAEVCLLVDQQTLNNDLES
jgi:hypothetical protein